MLPSNDNASTNLKSRVEASRILVPDDDFVKHYNVHPKELVPINRSNLTKPIKPEDIKQNNIGNCYFLVALASIIRTDANFLNQIMRINSEGKVEITFSDADDVRNKYTYVIDPTKVIKNGLSNPHTHDAIYLLEKAYSIHRLMLEPSTYTKFESVIKAKADLKPNDTRSDKQILAKLHQEIEGEINQQLVVYQKLLERLGSWSKIPQQNWSAEQVLIFSTFQEVNGNIEKALELQATKVRNSVEVYYQNAVSNLRKKLHQERRDYITALQTGKPEYVYRSLLGGKTQSVIIHGSDDFNYLTREFLLELITSPEPRFWSPRVKATIIRMFKDPDSQDAKLFIQAVTTMKESGGWQQLQQMLSEIENPSSDIDPRNVLQKILGECLNWSVMSENDQTRVLGIVLDFIEQNVPYKRGLGVYVPYQNEIYDLIKRNLQNGCFIAIYTGKDKPLKHGISEQHAYELLNCFERNGLKFVVLRNPWDETVRTYYYKDKKIGSETYIVLAAEQRTQLEQHSFWKLFKKHPYSGQIENVAIPARKGLQGNGIFEVELTDICKIFVRIDFALPSANSKRDDRPGVNLSL